VRLSGGFILSGIAFVTAPVVHSVIFEVAARARDQAPAADVTVIDAAVLTGSPRHLDEAYAGNPGRPSLPLGARDADAAPSVPSVLTSEPPDLPTIWTRSTP
jgi:hypothetical protein